MIRRVAAEAINERILIIFMSQTCYVMHDFAFVEILSLLNYVGEY